jgi:hypothetical protein
MLAMANQMEINLGTDWLYLFTANTGADYSKLDTKNTAWIPLPQLSDWSVTKTGQSGTDWFRRHIELEPTEDCVRYFLRIERVPEQVVIYLNGTRVDSLSASENRPLHTDVTDFVALGENILALKLTYSSDKSGGAFGRVTLIQTPCEEPAEGTTKVAE